MAKLLDVEFPIAALSLWWAAGVRTRHISHIKSPDSQLPALLNLPLTAGNSSIHVWHPEILELMLPSLWCNITKASYLGIPDRPAKNKPSQCSVRSCHPRCEGHQQGEAQLPALHPSSCQLSPLETDPTLPFQPLLSLPASVHLRLLCSKQLLDEHFFSLLTFVT